MGLRRGRSPRIGGAAPLGHRLRVFTAVLVVAGAVTASGPAFGVASPVSRAAASSSVGVGNTSCAPTGSGQTCSGTFGGETAWDWWIDGGTGGADVNGNINNLGGQTGLTPTVTVDQTANLTNQMVHVSWSNFTPTSTQNGNWPQWPNQYNGGQSQSQYAVSVYECGSATPASLSDCNSQFTNQGISQSGVKPNAVEGFTRGGGSTEFGDCTSVPSDTVCGTGYADIQIQTAVENNLLGCTDKHACSIVVVPNWGGVPNEPSSTLPPNAPTSCDDHTNDLVNIEAGYAGNSPLGEFDICAWNDRIVIPISFAKTPTQYCPASAYQFVSEGAPALERAMNQWRPAWCLDAQNRISFDYNSAANEYQARSDFLSGNAALTARTDVALVTDPPPSDQSAASSRKFTYAPIATTGIAVAYYIDDQKSLEPITDLKLNARLLAKLLTESYSLQFTQQCGAGQTTQTEFCDLGVVGNPTDIFADPEFLALNPQYTTADFDEEQARVGGDFYPIVIAGNSDLTYELTRWIVSDPAARAFLEGQPDPYSHMHVNTYFKTGQSYPISQFEIFDPGFNVANPSQGQYSIAMQNAWNPVTGLDNVAAHLANWTSSALSFAANCAVVGQTPPCPLTNLKVGPENLPTRTLFAIMDQGTAAAFRFPTAQLLNPAGNYEAPTIESMSAAVGAMKTNPDKITQYQDFAATSAGAYPLTEVQYAMVPTCGLSQGKVKAISGFLTNVATTAQLYGTDLGQLPPFGGYLALDDAQKAQTRAAAQAVSSQSCTSAAGDTTVSGQIPPKSSGGSGGGGGSLLGSSGVGGTGGGTLGGHSVSGTASPSAQSTPTAGAQANGQQPVGLGTKGSDSGDVARIVLIAALVLGGLLAIGGPLTLAIGNGSLPGSRRRRGKPGSGGGQGGLDG